LYAFSENLVPWARSEKNGWAVIQRSGMAEYFSVARLGAIAA